MSGLTRRDLLRTLGGLSALALPGRVAAFGDSAKVRLVQLRYAGGNPLPRPTGLRRLAWEIDKRTSVNVALDPLMLAISDRRLFRHPLLYFGGDKAFPRLSAAEIKRLHRHLIYGGTLIIDSADPRPGGDFDRDVRRMVGRLFGDRSLKIIGHKHTIHKSFYLLGRSVGRVAAVSSFEGVERDGRLLLAYCQNDLAGAWSRDNFGQWEFGVHPGGQRQRELAFRWGINLVMYALCVDYKADQVHVPFILKRRRWQIR